MVDPKPIRDPIPMVDHIPVVVPIPMVDPVSMVDSIHIHANRPHYALTHCLRHRTKDLFPLVSLPLSIELSTLVHARRQVKEKKFWLRGLDDPLMFFPV